MGEFFRKLGKICAKILKNTIGGRKLWGYFSRNLGKICANFQKQYWWEETMGECFQKIGEDMREFQKETILAGGNYGGISPEIWRRYARISKEQY